MCFCCNHVLIGLEWEFAISPEFHLPYVEAILCTLVNGGGALADGC